MYYYYYYCKHSSNASLQARHTWVDSAPASVAEVASMPADSFPVERTTGQVDASCFEACHPYFWLTIPSGADPMLKRANQNIHFIYFLPPRKQPGRYMESANKNQNVSDEMCLS